MTIMTNDSVILLTPTKKLFSQMENELQSKPQYNSVDVRK
jgi:hypothetical protein